MTSTSRRALAGTLGLMLASLEGTHIEAGPTIAAWAVIAAAVGAVVLIRNSSPASCSWNAGDSFR